MPDRHEAMHSVEDYLRTREEARKPQPIWSAKVVGVCLILFGGTTMAVSTLMPIEGIILRAIGFSLLPLGAAILLLGIRGGAKYRVTETTRYPQQTGEIEDMFFQIEGDRYLWVAVVAMVFWLLVLLV